MSEAAARELLATAEKWALHFRFLPYESGAEQLAACMLPQMFPVDGLSLPKPVGEFRALYAAQLASVRSKSCDAAFDELLESLERLRTQVFLRVGVDDVERTPQAIHETIVSARRRFWRFHDALSVAAGLPKSKDSVT